MVLGWIWSKKLEESIIILRVGAMRTIVVLGPAGSGKSVLSGVLYNVLMDRGIDVAIANLDPAVISYPYEEPDIDIRKYVKTEGVMRRFGLGPNGALIASMDIAIKFARRIKNDILSYAPEVLIVDTPGQLEVFVFRQSGIALLKEAVLSIPNNAVLALFLFDPVLCNSASSMLSLLLLSISAQLRINIPLLGALTKVDLFMDKEIKRMWYLLTHPKRLLEKVQEENILFPVRKINPQAIMIDIWPISSVTGEGVFDLLVKIEDILGEE